MASHSNDIFAPATGGPSHIQYYILPTIPDLYRPHNNDMQTPTVQIPHSFPYHTHPPVMNPCLPAYDRPPHPPLIHCLHDMNPPFPPCYLSHSESLQPYPPYPLHPPQHSY